jgi:hypothetical protein
MRTFERRVIALLVVIWRRIIYYHPVGVNQVIDCVKCVRRLVGEDERYYVMRVRVISLLRTSPPEW